MLLSPLVIVFLFPLALPQQSETLLRCLLNWCACNQIVFKSIKRIVLSQINWVFKGLSPRLVESWNCLVTILQLILVIELLSHYAVLLSIKASICAFTWVFGCFKILVPIIDKFSVNCNRKPICRAHHGRTQLSFGREIRLIILPLKSFPTLRVKHLDHFIRLNWLNIVFFSHLLFKVRQVFFC